MKVLFFWEAGRGIEIHGRSNPYAGLLGRALEPRGIFFDEGDYAFDRDWLEQQRADHEILHLHWLHGFYRTEDLQSTVARCSRFCDNLLYAREQLGYRVVWTMHNFYPHERPFPQVDHIARLFVSQHADAVIAHCSHAADLCRAHFHRKQVEIIPHGHFIDVFPNEVCRTDARIRLGIAPDAFVYLFFGNARGYKGIEALIGAFREIDPQDAVLLLMMRSAFDSDYARELCELAGGDARIHVHVSDMFPGSDFQIYLNSSDVVVTPFAEVLTSGSAIAALGFGKPVILPARGCLPDLVDDSMGILFEPDGPSALSRAMRDIRSRDLAAAGGAARARAESLDWGAIADRHAAVYAPA